MNTIYDIVIIGGGPAGYTAALYGARAGLKTLVLEKMMPGGQAAQTAWIDNYPGFADGVDGFQLGQDMKRGAERFGAVSKSTRVLQVRLQEKIKVVRTTGGEFLAKAVILATGAEPRLLGLPEEAGLTGKGVSYCAHCDGMFYKGKTVVVVGGGNTAVADALLLSRLAEKVILVHRRDSLRATKIYHQQLKQAENIQILWDSQITALSQNVLLSGVTVTNVKTGEKRHIPCNGLFVSIGRKPVTGLLEGQVALDENGYIVAGEDCKTNLPGVFAAGDVRTKELRQVVTAVADGAVAAYQAEHYCSTL